MDVWEVLVNLRESGLKNSGDLKTVHQHVALSLVSVAWEELYDVENEGFVLGSDGSEAIGVLQQYKLRGLVKSQLSQEAKSFFKVHE